MMNVPSSLGVRVAAIAIVMQTALFSVPVRAQSDWEASPPWPPSEDPVGSASAGFTLSLTGLDRNAMAGRAWYARLAVRNASTAAKKIAFAGMGCNYSFAFRDEASGATRFVVPRSCEVFNPNPMTLAPGGAAYLEVAVPPDATGTLRPGAVTIAARCDINVTGQTVSAVHLTSNAVPITVVADDGHHGPGTVFDNDAFYLGISSAADAGAAVAGLALSLTAVQSVPVGSAWSVALEVRNVSGEQQNVFGPIIPCQFNMIFQDRLSGAVHTASPEDDCDIYWTRKIRIPPGRSAFLRATLRADDLDFLRPGSTYVCVRADLPEDYNRGTPGRIVTSNGLLLHVITTVSPAIETRESAAHDRSRSSEPKRERPTNMLGSAS